MIRLCGLVCALALLGQSAAAAPKPAEIDAAVAQVMTKTGAKGLAVAVVDNGKPVFTRAYGVRNASGAPLTDQTVMYGASLTKAAFTLLVLQLVDEGRIDLDTPVERYLAKPLPDYPTEEKYAPWRDLAGDERWRKITPRILLTHSAGFANYAFLEPDKKLRIHFDPGSRYAYSGEGMILMQFVLERGLGLDVGAEMQRRVFGPFGMASSSMTWRPAFAANLADGWDADGRPQPHDERSRTRASGSMDTTITDMARLASGIVEGRGLTKASHAQMIRPGLPITTAGQFPTLLPELPPAARRPDLAAGLGVVVFDGPQGRGFYKGGHDEITGNTMVCVERGRRCAVLLSNDVRAEKAFPGLVRLILGETGAPWSWEYGPDAAGW